MMCVQPIGVPYMYDTEKVFHFITKSD